MRKLLGLVKEHGFERIDALKADIEGAEDLALLPFMEEAPREPVAPAHDPGEQRARMAAQLRRPILQERGYERIPRPGANVVLRLPPSEPARRKSRARLTSSMRIALVESDLLGAHAAAEGHRLDAGGDGLRRTPLSRPGRDRARA